MPRGSDRVANAQNKALETISNVATTAIGEEKEPVTPSAQVIELPQQETAEDKPKAKKSQQVEASSDFDRKRMPSEDFFDYLQRLTPDDWASGKTAGLYIYRENPGGKGNVQIERLHQAITFDQFANNYAPKFGPGTYLVQFQTALKHLTSCSHRVTFDGSTVNATGGAYSGSTGGSLTATDFSGFTDAMKQSGEMLTYSAKAAVDVAKANQLSAAAPVDIAGIVTAVAALIPKKDDNLLVTMLENQRQEAEKRAERQEKDAKDRQERADKEAKERADRIEREAKEREDRQDKFFTLMQTQQKEFYTVLLAEKDKKADTLGMGDVLKELFGAFARERLEGGGNDTLPGWAGVVQTALPKVADAVSTFMAVRAGASPQQIQQLQAAQQAQVETAHGPNGGMINPAPVSPLVSADQQLVDFINRLGSYVSTHENPDPGYMLTVINEEYGPIEDWIYRTPQDQIVAMLQNNPLGQRLLAIPNAPPFIEQLILGIKQPEADQEPEPVILPATAQQYSVEPASSKPKKRKQSTN